MHSERSSCAAAAIAVLALLAAPAAHAAHAGTPTKSFTIVNGDVQVRGGEESCFRISDTSVTSDRLIVHVRFKSTTTVPRGYVTLDGVRSAAFQDRSEEFGFVVDPRGTHRVALKLDERATVNFLSVESTESTLLQESCDTYEETRNRRVDLDPVTDPEPQTNRFETEEDRLRREREAAARGASSGTTAPSTGDRSGSQPTYRNPGGVIPSGTEMSLTLQGSIDTRSSYDGQVFQSTLGHDVVVDGRTLLPEGTKVEGHVIESKDAGRFGHSTLRLGFDRALLKDGQSVALQGSVQRVGKGSAKKQGGIIAGSAVGGAILGKVLGGSDQDALLGAIVGGGIAAGSIAAKPGEPIVLPAGSVLTVDLDGSAQVPPNERITPSFSSTTSGSSTSHTTTPTHTHTHTTTTRRRR